MKKYIRINIFILTITSFLILWFSPQIISAKSKDVLKMAILPNRTSVEIMSTYGQFIAAMEKRLDVKIIPTSGRNYDEIIALIKHKKVDLAHLGAFAYVLADQDFGVQLMVRTIEEGTESYRSIIITRKDSGITKLEEVKGKHFGFTDKRSTSGYLFPLLGLIKNGINLADFSKISFTKKHANLLLAVSNKQVQAGAMADAEFMDKYGVKVDELKILWKSEPIYHGVWAARNDMAKDKVEKIKESMIYITKNFPEIFVNSPVNGFVAAKDEEYNNVREALALKKKLEK